MSVLTSLLTALELTGGERIVLRSDERPYLILGDTRHDLDTAPVPTTTALEALADQILSPAGKQALAEQRVAGEPLAELESAIPVRVMVRRIGAQMCVELLRGTMTSETGHVAATAAAVAVTPPPAAAGHSVSAAVPAASIAASDSIQAPASIDATASAPELAFSIDTPMRILTRVDMTLKLTPSESTSPPPDQPVGAALSAAATAVPAPPLESKPEPVPLADTPRKIVDGSKRPAGMGALDYLIRQAARRNATALYLRAGHAPLARVGDRVEPLAADPLEGSVIDVVAAALAPGDGRRFASSAVWVREYEGIGQVRWHAFTDERGPGLVVHLAWQSPESILQRDIPRQVKRVCQEDDGIVVVSAAATAGMLEMLAAAGSWTAGRRAGYLISIEPPGGLGHDITGPFVSARKVGGADSDVAAAIRRAAHEAPDVLVVALPSGAAAEEALRAARTGCLIILGIVAPTTTRAIESLLAYVTPQQELELRRSLAAWFRCGFSYRALHTAGGGRKNVHDLLMATPGVRARLERGDVGALEKLQRSGTDGMRTLEASLASAVLRGDISVRQAATQAVDRREVVRMIRQSARERRQLRRDRESSL